MSTSNNDPSRRMFMAMGAAAIAGAALPKIADAQEQPSLSAASRSALAGKVAIVTGAARGIGRAVALDLAAAGADVAVLDIAARVSPVLEYAPATPEELNATADMIKQKGRRTLAIKADIRDFQAMNKAADEVVSTLGRIDIVVANAGVQAFSPILEMDDERWHTVMDVNVNGTVNTVRAFAPHLVKQKSGRIIITSSGQGRHGMKDGSAYSASKWALIGFMKSIALELGKQHVTVNTFEPGLVDTPLTRNKRRWQEAISEAYGTKPPENPTEDEVAKARLTQQPMGIPWMTPEQVAPVVTFLASDGAAWVTGATYDITAGDSAHYTG